MVMSFNFIFFSWNVYFIAGKIFGKLFQKVQLKRYDTYFIYLPISFAVTIGKPATNRNVYYICLFFFFFFIFMRKSPSAVFVNDSRAAEIHWFSKREAKVNLLSVEARCIS